ncbi:sugar ABC transporter substrate-binding protein [Asanoa ishikariensis]|uniref:Carbohydrate ABC transporter substrate-binding protein, CUT1 family n=1 Tax=Asanoa ishikariensis TaxID=137265 RepID=A0A1H3UEJ3_9ACTN|nr:sugar ABC transporter substrate-binding protein [Asanoa ishikariensis]GIF63725.1 sugar ABC transporter substrate-binding protein [Asanoa ishikariensis]SDZ60798.1 carbohydrate ABC transporter substrate-binding protein, CUT1 family [Asanoa ishikariensis]
MRSFVRRAAVPVIAGLVLALAACSQGSATRADEPVAGKTTVRYMNFSANDGHEKDLDAIKAAFQTANPDITVQIETLPYADYFTKLQTAVAGGTAGDAFELNYENFVTYTANGSLAELKDVDAAPYKASLLEAFKADGKQYGLPASFSNVVLFYNKDLFKAAGVAPPTASWTWADEQAAATKLTNKGKGVWGDYQPISFFEFYKALAQAGGEFLAPDKKSSTFNSDAGRKAAEFLVAKAGKTMPTEAQGAGTPDFDSKLFKDGKLAMWHSGIWMFSGLADAKFDWDIAVEPGDTTKASAMFTNGAVVSAASKNQAAAQKWVTFLTSSDDMVKARLATSWELPPVADTDKVASYLTAGKPANRQAVFDSLDATVLPPVIERQQEMQDAVTKELSAAAAGRKDVATALADAQKAVDKLLS